MALQWRGDVSLGHHLVFLISTHLASPREGAVVDAESSVLQEREPQKQHLGPTILYSG